MAAKSPSTTIASALIATAALARLAAADESSEQPASGGRLAVEQERVLCTDTKPHGHCDAGAKTRIVAEQDLTIKVDVALKPSATCAATIESTSEQRDTTARVSGAIENVQCAASSGTYVLALTIRGADGEARTLEFPESWQRADDKPVRFSHDLPIGPNVDLLKVRPHGLRCTCAEAQAK